MINIKNILFTTCILSLISLSAYSDTSKSYRDPQPYPDFPDQIVQDMECTIDTTVTTRSPFSQDKTDTYKEVEIVIPTQTQQIQQTKQMPTPLQETCQPTTEVWHLKPIVSEHTSNVLWRQVGSPYFAEGKRIMITGRILDAACVPITGAKVEISQVDSNGNELHDQNYDVNFNYSGTAITDNIGRYAFYTVMPDLEKNNKTWINFSIKHDEIGSTETTMFFNSADIGKNSDVNNNKEDKPDLVASYTEHDKKNNFDIYNFDIILNNVLNYKQY